MEIKERVLGLDYGTVRIGVAVSDPFGWTAQGLGVIHAETEDIVRCIQDYIEKYDIKKIVLGFPRNMNGTIGPRADAVLAFQESLTKDIDIPIVLVDERLSTRVASQVLNKADVRNKKKKQVIDKLAAQVILQTYLDQNEETSHDA